MSRRCDENGYITTTTEADPIEYAPVRHGRWIDVTGSFKTRLPKTTRTDEDEYITIRNYITTYKCSVCHTVFQRDYKYCPNCGAIMDEVSE